MKITGYNQVVGTGGAVNATVKAVSDLNAYGGKGDGARAVSNALGKVQAAYEHVAEEEDKRALMSAMDIYNKGRYDILYNDENGVLNTKLEGAAGSVGSYIEREKKLRNDIMGNIKFKTQKYQLAFQDMVNKSADQGYQLVDRHQYKEMEAQQDVVLNNNLNNVLMMAQKNYSDDVLRNNSVEEIKRFVSGRYSDRGEEYVKTITNNVVSKLGKSIIEEAILRGEYDVAEKNMQFFNPVFTPELRDALEKNLFNKQEEESNMALAESLASQYGENIGGIVEALKNTNAFGTDRLMNLAERQRVLNIAQSIVNTNKAIERAKDNQLCDSASETVIDMLNAGKTYKEAIAWATEQSGADSKTRNNMYRVVNMLYKNIDSKVVALGENEKGLLLDMLQEGRFSNKIAFLDFASEQGANAHELRALKKHYDDYINCQGEFNFKWNDTLKEFVEGSKLKGEQKVAFNKGLKTMAINYVREYRAANNGESPEDWQVTNYLKQEIGKNFFVTVKEDPSFTNWAGRSTYEYTPFDLARAGIKRAEEVGDNLYKITYSYDNATMYVSSEYLASLLAGGNN